VYLEKRRRRYYAVHDIPADCQEALGSPGKPRRRFIQSLKTDKLATAKIRATALEGQWLTQIERARKGATVEDSAAFWRDALKGAIDQEHREAILHLLLNEVEIRAGTGDPDEIRADPDAQRFLGVATGDLVAFDARLGEYLGTLRLEAKTVAMRRAIIEGFAEAFPYVADVTRKAVQGYVNRLLGVGKAVATIRHDLSNARQYWGYLQSVGDAPEDARPFDLAGRGRVGITLAGNGKSARANKRKPLEPGEVAALLDAARGKSDGELADLIDVLRWTGCRCEEAASLKVEQVNLATGTLTIDDAKSEAGNRTVPVRPELADTLRRLIGDRREGYVFAGLRADKHGDRSTVIRIRGGDLLREIGITDKAKVLHSIRHGVVTQMLSADVQKHVIQAIVGHALEGVTVGVYGRTSVTLAQKRAAILKLSYCDK